MDLVTQSIRQIEEGMLAHNADDKNQFISINEKLDAMHDLHIRNEETLKQILAQATKTNGRVTDLERVATSQDKTIALLAQVSSSQHNQYENFVTQQEKNGNGIVTKDTLKNELWALKAIVYGGTGIALTGIVGAILSKIIIK